MNRREMLQLSAALAASGGLRPRLAGAADSKITPDEMIHKYLAAEVERLSRNFMDGAKTKDEWLRKRPLLKKQFLDMAGLDPLPEKTPLKAKVTRESIHAGVVVENVHFQSRPGLYVTGNLYRPIPLPELDKPAPRLPGILYVCGHSNRGRAGNKTAFQDHGLWFAANGYVCLIVDTLQLGEIAGKHHGTYNLERWWWHSRGYTPAGVELWNGIRGIDYLCSRPEVDPERIGVTGISGGGATTVWVAAADDRVKVAVPVSGMSDLESYVTNKVINGHCDCMFVYNTYRWEWTTILALFAPKPLLFANSDTDPIFPMDGNRRIIARLRSCYELLGAKDKVDEYVSRGGHDYRPDLRAAIFSFLNKHLKGDAGPVKDAAFPKIEGKDLRVFPADTDLPKDPINATADEVFVPKATVKLPAEPKDFAAWKAGLVKQLRERCFRALPEKVPAAEEIASKDIHARSFSAEPGLEFAVNILRLSAVGDRSSSLLFLNSEDDLSAAAEKWVKRYEKSSGIAAVYGRGGAEYKWSRKSPPNTVERSLALVGQTADSGRVRDIAAYLARWQDRDTKEIGPVRTIGVGPAGIIAAYAALFTPGSIDEAIIVDPPTSHRDGPHILGVMRVLDIPEALGLLAPDVKLTLLGKHAKDNAFDKTAAIYKLAGAEDKFKR